MPVPHPNPLSQADYSAVELSPDGERVLLLDQRCLPGEERYLWFRDADELARAIREMVVRGAPAIGIAAGYAMALEARAAPADAEGFLAALAAAAERLRQARLTAVNLAWAVERMLQAARAVAPDEPGERALRLAEQARALHRADVAANRRLGELGAERLPDGARIYTHCNAGALATGGYGTALGVVRAARDAGKRVRVIAGETRPWLQGARLTAWELQRDGIPVELVADSAAAWLMAKRGIDAVVVGADRIARSGDVANKIGTYSLACHAGRHRVPFYVAAPWSTVDLACPDGSAIPIEERAGEEVTELAGTRVAAPGVGARNPAFDVTPAELVTAIVTERGIVEPPGEAALLARGM